MLLLRLCMAGIVEYVARHSPKQSEIEDELT